MKKAAAFILLLYSFIGTAQQDVEPFDMYGPPGLVYTSMPDALLNVKKAYKVKIDDKIIDPKQLHKLGKLVNVQALQLSNNGLTVLPPEFSKLTNLFYFATIGNEITKLPEGFENLEQLTELHLHSVKMDSLSTKIAYHGRLKTLAIQNNKADTFSFPDSFGYLPNLNTLLLYNTKLDTLPATFGNLKRLKSLTIVKCGFNRIELPVCAISSLELLVLDHNGISELPDELFSLTNLKYLSLQRNNLSHISDYVCFLENLEVLDLRGNYFKEYSIAILKALLPKCRILY